MSNNIFARTSQQQSASQVKSKKSETAETAGSLAMKSEKSYLAENTYDTVAFNNASVMTIDFSNYATVDEGGDSAGFLSSFANAVAVIGTGDGGFSGGGVSAGASCSSGSCGGGGGFTSFV